MSTYTFYYLVGTEEKKLVITAENFRSAILQFKEAVQTYKIISIRSKNSES